MKNIIKNKIMARITGGISFNLEHEDAEVATAIALVKKLPEIVEAHNASVSIKSNKRVSKAQLELLESWYNSTESFEKYLKNF
jgi:ribosomal protein S24E